MRRFGLLLPALLLSIAAGARAEDLPARLEAALKPLEGATPQTVWQRTQALDALGRESLAALQARLAQAEEPARLALARRLLELGEGASACPALLKLAREGSPEAREVAVRVLGEHGGGAAIQPLLELLEDASLSKPLRIQTASSLWKRSQNMKAVQLCRELLEDADAPVRAGAALALGRMGRMTDARRHLELLALEPTRDGEEARQLLLADRLAQTLSAQERPEVREGQDLLAEIAGMVQRFYVDEAKTDTEDLFDAAAKGLASSLDPHSSYMGRKEKEEMDQRMDGHYAGIGAVVSKTNGVLTIESTFFEGPAYRAGIRSGDVIFKIEGMSAMDFALEEAVSKLKGVPGTPVSFEILRKGAGKPIPFTLKRAVIDLKSSFSDMLPGDLGYLRLTTFAKQTADDLKSQLEDLRKRGMKGLILDLRGNGGGLLTTAVEVVDLFVKPGLLVVYSEGRNPEIAAREDYISGGRLDEQGVWRNPPRNRPPQRDRPDFPMVILIDHGSASASEIVSGALRDHKRAALVGEKTFGKGSVQQLRHLESTHRETLLRLTIAKYYLPSGVCIHGVGVEPDVTVTPPEVAGWKFEEYRRLADDKAFDHYLDSHPAKDFPALAALSADDGGKWEGYPDFQPFYEGLKTSLSKDDVRLYLRRLLRERTAEERGKSFETDLQDDVQLQRAVLELLKRAGIDPKSVPAYAALPERFPS